MSTHRPLDVLKKYAAYLSLSILLLQGSCVSQQTSSTSLNDTYSEDLTVLRPKFELESIDSTIAKNPPVNQVQTGTATRTVNTKVDAVLDSLNKLNQLRKYIDGYTIQIYSGPNREDALGAKSKMVKEAGDLEANIQYAQPKFRVTVGGYYSKLEAQKDLMRLRRIFSNAILLPEKIMIK